MILTRARSPTGGDTYRPCGDLSRREAHWRHLGTKADVLGHLHQADVVVKRSGVETRMCNGAFDV